MNVTYVERDMA